MSHFRLFLIFTSVLFLIGCNANKEIQDMKSNFSTQDREVNVYTTAKDTELRLNQTGKKIFESADSATRIGSLSICKS